MIRRRYSHKRIAALATFVLLISTFAVFAQSTATIQGAVMDESGAVVAKARIVARNTATGIERTTETDSAGNYLIASLPVGTYRLETQAQGFQSTVVNDLVLEVGKTTSLTEPQQSGRRRSVAPVVRGLDGFSRVRLELRIYQGSSQFNVSRDSEYTFAHTSAFQLHSQYQKILARLAT